MHKHLLYLFLFLLVGCSVTEKKSENVFFAGEVVNPTSKYIILYKGENSIDSAQLDANNRFSLELDSPENGLYHFKHSPEFQYVYLEKGDSLLIRLNTMDFDESLVFSGSGSEINNFLLELFLAREAEQSIIYGMYRLEPEDFNKKIDSLKQSKLEELEILVEESELSKRQREIAEASIVYNYYTYKEKYPFKHKSYTGNKVVDELPPNFYDYRKTVTYQNKDFTYLRPYYNFMINHFGNRSYMSCSKKCGIKNDVVKNHLHFNMHKLGLIDSLVKDKDLKDNLFRNVAFDYLLQIHDTEENNEIFIKEFHKLSENNKHISEIDELYKGILNIQPDKEIPNINVLNSEGERVSLKEIAKDTKTVFYFWSGTDKRHFDNITRRADYLSSKMSEYRFVGINLKTDDTKWKIMIETKNLDKNNQYRAVDFEEVTKALVIYPMNKCIITEDAKIVDAFSNMYASSF
ncbi:transaldolase [Ulvibacterium sp.]|uniref:transaldolase n=1 Tax=Ulvibacterium sp. TaxID=2665914 RepID=UPI003CC6DB06